MKNFALLPAEARRGLARKELARRGINAGAADSRQLEVLTDDELEQLENMLAPYARKEDEVPPEVHDAVLAIVEAAWARAREAVAAAGLDPQDDEAVRGFARDQWKPAWQVRLEARNAGAGVSPSDQGLGG